MRRRVWSARCEAKDWGDLIQIAAPDRPSNAAKKEKTYVFVAIGE